MNTKKLLRYIFLIIKKREIRQKLKKLNKMKYYSSHTKSISGSSDAFNLKSETENKVLEVKNSVESIIKQSQADPNKLLEYVKATGTPVYRFPNAKKILMPLKEETGFICEKKGLEAIYLSFVTEHKLKLHTQPMFILKTGRLETYLTIYNFYLWYSQKSGLEGFSYEIRKKFNKYYLNNSNEATNKLSLKDIYEIQEAINREKEATNFMLNYEKQIEGSKNVLNKIKNDGSANI